MKTLESQRLQEPEASSVSDSDNLNWLLANFDRLLAEYPGQYLAVEANRVIAAAESPAELRRLLDLQGVTSPLITRAHPDAWRAAH
jgi:hypothetical protein